MSEAAKRFDPPRPVKLSSWLEDNYYLPPEACGVITQYSFENTPYFLGVANVLSNEKYEEIVLMKASQIGWTYFLIGFICYKINLDPSAMMVIFAKEKDGKAFHDEKLLAVAKCNPCLDGKIDPNPGRKPGQRWDLKKFVDGFLKLVGSNSPGNVKSTSSVGTILLEEPDDTADDIKGQGDAISNARERIKRASQKKMVVGGTPAVQGYSKTQKMLDTSNRCVLPVVCHSCGVPHVLSFDNVFWDGKDQSALEVDVKTGEILQEKHDIFGFSKPETAIYRCPHCNVDWDDEQRKKNIRSTAFNADAAGDELAGWVATKPYLKAVGFMDLSELYVCIAGSSLSDLVISYLDAVHYSSIGDESKMIVFKNQKLGKTYSYDDGSVDADALRDKAENDRYGQHQHGSVPEGAILLTAGIDVQHDRFEFIIRGYGIGEESWLIRYHVVYAENSLKDVSDPAYKELEEQIFSTLFDHPLGGKLRISAVTIDTSDGQTSDATYAFARLLKKKYKKIDILPGKGSNSRDAEIYIDPNRDLDDRDPKAKRKKKSKARKKFNLRVFNIGTHKAKDLLSSRMTLEGFGPGKFHFCVGVPAGYYEQMTSESRVPKGGYFDWEKDPGKPNEAWDCEVYSLHAARSQKSDTLSEVQWLQKLDEIKDYELRSSESADIDDRYTPDYWRR